jgi:hypothetical protein
VEQLITNMDLLNGLLEDMITYSRADSGLITLDMSMWGGGRGRSQGEEGGRRKEEGRMTGERRDSSSPKWTSSTPSWRLWT